MQKLASTDHPIHELIASRWSPYGFSDRPVSESDLRSLFEAARWAASSYNEQPWTFCVATKEQPDQFERLLSCLVEPNRAWAEAAAVLVLTCTSLNFQRNAKPNTAAIHDVGLAVATLSFEATSRGLSVHQMIGILPDQARGLFEIPDGVQPVTAIAIGYASDPEELTDSHRERDLAHRQRKSLDEFVFTGKWGETAELVKPTTG